MAIATALRGFNDLGQSVTPTFLSRNILFTMIYTLSKNEQKLSVGIKKKFKRSVHRTSNPAFLGLQGA